MSGLGRSAKSELPEEARRQNRTSQFYRGGEPWSFQERADGRRRTDRGGSCKALGGRRPSTI
jgi:hypothetical protein